jgi:hypothetical protein
MIRLAPLLADAEQLLGIVIFIIVAVLSALGQMMNKQREAKAAQELARRRAAAGQAQPQQPQRPAGGLEDEIGEFLRRATQGRAGQPAQQVPAQRPAATRRPAQRPPRPAERPVEAQVVEPRRGPVGGRVGDMVSKDLDTSDIKKRTQQLGTGTKQAVQAVQQHLRQKFDHKVSTLAAEPSKTAEAQPKTPGEELPATAAAGFAAMLTDINNVRQAIILNEILQRPEHRWSRK